MKVLNVFNPISMIKDFKKNLIRKRIIKARNKAGFSEEDFGILEVEEMMKDMLMLMNEEGYTKEYLYSKFPDYFKVHKLSP